MSMTRDQAIEYLADSLGPLLQEAGISPDTSGLNSVLDDALLLMGTSYDALADAEIGDGDIPGYRAVLRYAALLKAQDALLTRVNTSISLGTPSVSKSVSGQQITDTLAKRLVIAKAEAEPYLAAGTGSFTTGTIQLGAFGGACWS
jgi:hypothetical protein